MTSETELKIVEKIKFWEEQEKINGILAERLLHLNTELTIITAENEVIKNELTILTAENEVIKNELNILSSKTGNIGLSGTKIKMASFVAFILSIISLIVSLFF